MPALPWEMSWTLLAQQGKSRCPTPGEGGNRSLLLSYTRLLVAVSPWRLMNTRVEVLVVEPCLPWVAVPGRRAVGNRNVPEKKTALFAQSLLLRPLFQLHGRWASPLSSFLYGEGTQGRFLWSCCLPTSTAAFPAPAWLPLSAGVPLTQASVAMAASHVPQKVTPESCTTELMLSLLPGQAGMPLLLHAIYFSAFATRPSFRFHARRSLEMELALRYFHYVQ